MNVRGLSNRTREECCGKALPPGRASRASPAPGVGARGHAAPADPDPYVYVAVRAGRCAGVVADLKNQITGQRVARLIAAGAVIERVPLSLAKRIIGEAWPPPHRTVVIGGPRSGERA